LVIGEGKVNGTSVSGNEIDGTMIVAQTRDSSFNLLTTLGPATVNWTNGKGSLFYDSCWINNAMSAFPTKCSPSAKFPNCSNSIPLRITLASSRRSTNEFISAGT